MRLPVAFLAILAALACHSAAPGAGETLPVASVEPLVACVQSALASSRMVAKAGIKKDYPRTLYATFVNPPDPYVTGIVLDVAPSRGTPTQFVVEYAMWRGKLYKKPGIPNLAELNAPAVQATITQLLNEVAGQCAPSAPGAPSCSMSYLDANMRGRCSIGI